MKKTVGSVLFVAFLLWRGAVAVAGLAAEVGQVRLDDLCAAVTLGQDERIARELASWARRVGLPADHYDRLYRALLAHVPADGVVAFVSRNAEQRLLTYTHMTVLLSPRRFYLTEALPEGWQQELPKLGASCFVLEYSTPADPTLGSTCDQLASSEEFRLWRLRGAPR